MTPSDKIYFRTTMLDVKAENTVVDNKMSCLLTCIPARVLVICSDCTNSGGLSSFSSANQLQQNMISYMYQQTTTDLQCIVY